MNFLKQNWFKLIIAVTVVLVGVSCFYYFVILSFQKETRIQEKAQADLAEKVTKEQAAAIDEYWNGMKDSVQKAIDAGSKIRSSAQDMITAHRDWVNRAYAIHDNNELVPLINASEHYITTLQSLVDSVNKLDSIRYKILTAIQQRNQTTIDSLAIEESNAVDTMTYWADKEKSEAAEVNALKTQSIQNF